MAEWELSKENAQPLKRGRDVKKVRDFKSNAQFVAHKSELQARQEQFEDMLVDARSDGPMDDPLDVWVQYIKWVQENFPRGSQDLVDILERCTREFKDDERYKNDEKYIKVWIGYADVFDNPSKIFKYLRENKIGEKVALYYVATAWTAERRGDFSLADKAYSVGLEKHAKPIELLKNRHREFQRRMSRRWLDQAEKAKNGQTDEAEEGEDAQSRQHLRAISRSDAGSMHRPLGAGPRQPAHPNRPRERGTRGLTQGGANALVNDENVDQSFGVYAEEQPEQPQLDDWGMKSGKTGWKHLETRDQSMKENSLQAGPWVDQGFGSHKECSSEYKAKPAQAAPAPGPAFGVFLDSTESIHERGEENPTAQRSNSNPAKQGLKVRSPQQDKTSLYKKPLQNFDKERDEAAPTTRQRPSTPQSKGPPPSQGLQPSQAAMERALDCLDADDVTINTRLAIDDAGEWFNSPSPRRRSPEAGKDENTPPRGTSFSAFQDSPLEGYRSRQDQASVPSAAPFSAFDEQGDSDVDQASRESKPKPSFSVFSSSPQTSPQIVPRTSKAPFSVFGASEDPDALPSPKPLRPKAPFAVFGATAASPEVSKTKAKAPFAVFGASTEENSPTPASGLQGLSRSPKVRKPFQVFAAESEDEEEQFNADVEPRRLAFHIHADDSENIGQNGRTPCPDDVENYDETGRRNTAKVAVTADEDRALVEVDPSLFDFSSDEENEREEEHWMRESKTGARLRQPAQAPEGFSDVPDATKDQGGEGFTVFSDDQFAQSDDFAEKDDTLTFDKLESILEASTEADESFLQNR
mmetsp:Transcript_13640/g.24311  ORF Transcript_13640/g.24311 Transcript_13640/m.24311 type:complete len:808 (+) Transcript_13640:99-2522(+)